MRLAHRVKELDELPHNLSAMPSINKVKDWYAQSFEVPCLVNDPCTSRNTQRFLTQELISFPAVKTSKDVQTALKLTPSTSRHLPESVPNPSFNGGLGNTGSGKMRIPIEKRRVGCPHPCFCPLRGYSCIFLQVLCADLWDRLAARSPGLQCPVDKTPGKHQAEARPHCDHRRSGCARVEADAQSSQDRQRNSGLA